MKNTTRSQTGNLSEKQKNKMQTGQFTKFIPTLHYFFNAASHIICGRILGDLYAVMHTYKKQ